MSIGQLIPTPPGRLTLTHCPRQENFPGKMLPGRVGYTLQVREGHMGSGTLPRYTYVSSQRPHSAWLVLAEFPPQPLHLLLLWVGGACSQGAELVLGWWVGLVTAHMLWFAVVHQQCCVLSSMLNTTRNIWPTLGQYWAHWLVCILGHHGNGAARLKSLFSNLLSSLGCGWKGTPSLRRKQCTAGQHRPPLTTAKMSLLQLSGLRQAVLTDWPRVVSML